MYKGKFQKEANFREARGFLGGEVGGGGFTKEENFRTGAQKYFIIDEGFLGRR
jgi:hypothetical protein